MTWGLVQHGSRTYLTSIGHQTCGNAGGAILFADHSALGCRQCRRIALQTGGDGPARGLKALDWKDDKRLSRGRDQVAG
jgi:hypothetical protein